jgi:hypothetical protein
MSVIWSYTPSPESLAYWRKALDEIHAMDWWQGLAPPNWRHQ